VKDKQEIRLWGDFGSDFRYGSMSFFSLFFETEHFLYLHGNSYV